MTDPPPPEPHQPHPLDVLRQEAAHTTTQAVRDQLGKLTEQHFALVSPHGWAVGAEDALRTAIGMERKAQMEMRIGLGADADGLPIRKTAPLSELNLTELLAEYRENRLMTLKVLDLLLDTAKRREVRAWTLGEEVPPELHILSLRRRLIHLAELLADHKHRAE